MGGYVGVFVGECGGGGVGGVDGFCVVFCGCAVVVGDQPGVGGGGGGFRGR